MPVTLVINDSSPEVVLIKEESAGIIVTSSTAPGPRGATGPQGESGAAILAVSGKGFINHGTVADVARPTDYASVEWYGSAQPVNAVIGDTWVDTA